VLLRPAKSRSRRMARVRPEKRLGGAATCFVATNGRSPPLRGYWAPRGKSIDQQHKSFLALAHLRPGRSSPSGLIEHIAPGSGVSHNRGIVIGSASGSSLAQGDRKLGVLVRAQYAVARGQDVMLGVVSYSGWGERSHRRRTRLTVHPRSTTPSRTEKPLVRLSRWRAAAWRFLRRTASLCHT
jgi:hypothetical protein